MTHTIWNDLCNQPTLTASSDKYAQLVHNATTLVHEGIQLILSALDQRATGSTKCANFEAALHDAKLMQQFSPFSARGYIREASIYSEQGKQRQAIDICDKGMSMVNTKDTYYDDLKRAKMDAEQRQNTRIDFVSQLPLDIVITTLIPMLVKDSLRIPEMPSPYVFISKTWRDRIVECFGGLRFEIGYFGGHRDRECLEVAKFARYTKELKVSSYSQGRWVGDLLSQNDFCMLRKLCIAEFSNNHVDHFVSCLESISNTLTHLNISFQGAVLSVPTIVKACPNLVSLCIFNTPNAGVSSLPMKTWPALRTLSLTFSQTALTCDEIVWILRRFPSLKRLELHPCSDIESALIVLRYAPRISNIELLMRDKGVQLTYVDEGHACEGITHLTMKTETGQICNNTATILKQHHETLERIEWDMDDESVNRDIYDMQFPQLKKLVLNKAGWWIPRNAPLLEELEMTLATIDQHPAVLLAIPPKLKKLALDLRQGLNAANNSTIEHYLDRFAHQHPLKELDIKFDSKDNVGNLLEAIHRHNQLEVLKVTFTGTWCSYPMDQFLGRLIKGCPRLVNLEFISKTSPTANSIALMQSLQHLKYLAFSLHGTGGRGGFWHIIPTFLQLKYLKIYAPRIVNKKNVDYFLKQRPDMQIIIDNHTIIF
ncbi:hypothetical protein O0I10_006247 [Lichtheimia ornata]|uniref:F-box domain-containing protein n=1 Tax=Lichtheimia ornata TaxID=688661 RepID=A0AAD7V3N6_9FUNG|nr:uncharacterized protein O0I10_006247 [Lichtheimia ornata]KAJ8657976.1 hypothetical protein O0I10_006247 [Lichtheimia ornata]